MIIPEDLMKKTRRAINEGDISVEVDIYNLEIEFKKQSVLYHRYSQLIADLEDLKYKQRKETDDITRSSFVEKNKKLPSETFVENSRVNDNTYMQILHLINKLNGTLKSLDHKKKSLEKLADLHIAGYYSEPKERNHNAQ